MKQDEIDSGEMAEAEAVRELLTVEQAASYLHMSVSSIHSYFR